MNASPLAQPFTAIGACVHGLVVSVHCKWTQCGEVSKQPYGVTSPNAGEQYPGSNVATGWAGTISNGSKT